MKTFTFIFLAIFLSVGCASSDKKSAAKNQAATDNQTATQQEDSLVAKPFSSVADTSGLVRITGQLNYTGNEPFTKPAIFVSGTEMYVLKADKTFIDQTFSTINGKQATIFGKIDTTEHSPELEVHYYELREN